MQSHLQSLNLAYINYVINDRKRRQKLTFRFGESIVNSEHFNGTVTTPLLNVWMPGFLNILITQEATYLLEYYTVLGLEEHWLEI